MQRKNFVNQHQLHEKPGTSKLPAPRLTQQPAPTNGLGRLRRQRKSNFSNGEVEILVREVASRRDVLFGTRGTRNNSINNKGAGGANKMGEWREIAGAVNGAGIGERRTVREVRKKWENVVSSFRRKIRQPNLLTSLIGTGRCPADEALACANAYCGVQQQPICFPQQQQHQQVFDRLSDSGHKQEELSCDEPMFLQPEVQIELDDSTMHFGDSSDACGRSKEANAETEATQKRLSPAQEVEDQEPQLELRQIEQQKLQVMRELLKVETKRLKVEKKRLKVERMRLQIDLQSRMHPSPVSLAAYKQ